MTMKGYKICFATDTITVTKKFMEDASVINSAAFKEMMALRKLGMAIVVREIKERIGEPYYRQGLSLMSEAKWDDAIIAFKEGCVSRFRRVGWPVLWVSSWKTVL